MKRSDHVRVYVDTEFSDFTDLQLLSIALVMGETEFYAEADHLPDSCTPFVRETVIPLLRKRPSDVLPPLHMREALVAWLLRVKGAADCVVVSYDAFEDWVLLVEVIGRCPQWLRGDNIRHRVDEQARAGFFQTSGLPPHHALHDARALQHGHCAWRTTS